MIFPVCKIETETAAPTFTEVHFFCFTWFEKTAENSMASTIHTLVLVAFFLLLLLLLQRRKIRLQSSSSTLSSSPVVRLPDDPILRKSKLHTTRAKKMYIQQSSVETSQKKEKKKKMQSYRMNDPKQSNFLLSQNAHAHRHTHRLELRTEPLEPFQPRIQNLKTSNK
jgi:hypothetical protein